MTLDQKIRAWNHRRIILFRRWRLQILKFLIDQKLNPLQTALRPEKGRDQRLRIIILRTDGKLGDSITSTYLLKGLKQQFPNCHLTIVSQPEYKNLFWGLADDYIPLRLNFLAALKFISKNSETYDFLINSSHILNPSSILLSRFIPASKKIAFLNDDWKLFSDHVRFDVNNDHITERYNQLLKQLLKQFSANQIPQLFYSYEIDHDSKMQVVELLSKRRDQHPYKQLIIVNSFAGARLRNFNLVTTKSIVTELSAQFPMSLIVSIGHVGDLKVLDRWHSELQNPQWTFFNYGSLEFNAALVSVADLVISPDTSIVHMASALKKKLVAVYRDDNSLEKNQKIWAPFGTEFVVVVAPENSSHYENGDINSVNIPEIILACEKLMRST